MQQAAVSIEPMTKWNSIEETIEVLPTEVSDYIRKGYVILMAYMSRTDIPAQTFENGYVVNNTRCEYEPIVLMGRTDVDSLREKVANLQARCDQLLKCESELHEAKKERIVLDNKLNTATSENVRIAKQFEEKRNEVSAIQTTKYKLEGDIAKIRNAIGEIKMKEILETK